jgi:hypothetical protein
MSLDRLRQNNTDRDSQQVIHISNEAGKYYKSTARDILHKKLCKYSSLPVEPNVSSGGGKKSQVTTEVLKATNVKMAGF